MGHIRSVAYAIALLFPLCQCTIQDDIYRLQNQVRAVNQKVEALRAGEMGSMERRQASAVNKLGEVEDETQRMRSNMEDSIAQNSRFQTDVKQSIAGMQASLDSSRQASDSKVAELNARIAALESQLQRMHDSASKAQQEKVAAAEQRAAEAQKRAEEARRRANDAARPGTTRPGHAPEQGRSQGTTAVPQNPAAVQITTASGKTRVAGDEVAVRNGSGAAAASPPGTQRAASTPAATQAQTRAASPGGSAAPGTANVAMPASTPASAPAASSSDPYSRGISQYNGRQYKEAYKSFEKALAANPNGSKAADTLYHMGESLFNQGEYDLAILDYQKVISNHASSALASKALLKQGMSFEKLTDNETAKIIYRKLLSDYKQSPEASQAQERLNKL